MGVALFCLQILSAQPSRNLGVVDSGESVRVIAIGDWGYVGEGSGQREVAAAIRKIHDATPYDLGLTLGDNFYPAGVKTVNDALWTKLWEQGYANLGIPFFAALGNHDYRGNEQAEVDYSARSKTWRMPFRYYTFTAGPIQFFALDTDEDTAGAILFRAPWTNQQAIWLDGELARSKANWKVVYGHHPIYSDGHHGDDRRLKRKLLPILKARHVDMYICGHEHDLQVHETDGMTFLIGGGGGKDPRPVRMRRAKFVAGRNGFLELSATGQRLEWRIRSAAGGSLAAGVNSQLAAPTTTEPGRTRSAPSSPRR